MVMLNRILRALNIKQDKLTDNIRNQNTQRLADTVRRWRDAIDYAEDIYAPDRTELYEIYRNATDDYQIATVMQTRSNRVKLTPFYLANADGTRAEEETAKLQNFWTLQFIDYVMDSLYYGYSLVQIDGIENGNIKSSQKIDPRNTVPEWKAVKKDYTDDVTNKNVIFIEGSSFEPWLIEMFQSRTDLGLINKVVPYYIWKKVFGSWAQHADIFGMDVRVIRTNLEDTLRKQNAENMLRDMQRAAYGVFDLEDELQFIGTSRSDAYNIYERLIEKCDSAISKVFLGQTGTTDEKAYAGSADVHRGILDDYTESDKVFVQFKMQELYIPWLQKNGILPAKPLLFYWDESVRLNIMQKRDIVRDLAPYFHFSPEYLEDWMGITVEDKTPTSGPSAVMNQMAKLYLNAKEKKEKKEEPKNPFQNEHAARLLDPNKFEPESFRRKEITLGVTAIVGKLIGDDAMTIQAYRFSTEHFTEKDARKWLKDNKIKFILFEPAEPEVEEEEEEDKQ